jgi:glucans biosynthesis protein
MYFFGENQRSGRDDYRPEVHDSDGLSMQSGTGEWIWRPLVNPKRLLVTSFGMTNPVGFGLMQRDRDFAHYEDLEARYDLRPSGWVEPKGSWGPGRVELVQIPSADETNDNVVAYWVPERIPEPGKPLDVAYRMHWQGDRQQRPPAGWTVQSRLGHGLVNGKQGPREVQYVVDFDGPALRGLPADAAVSAVVTANASAVVIDRNAYRNPATGTWRMTVRVDRVQSSPPAELRAFLQRGNSVLTETWTTIIPPG